MIQANNAQAYEGRTFRLVAIDIDGTLLRSDKRLSLRVVKRIHQASKLGVKVVLASARPPRTVKEIYKILKLDTLQINYNGAVIHDASRDKAVYHLPVKPRTAANVCKLARYLDPKIAVSLEILDRWCTDFVDPTLDVVSQRNRKPHFTGPLETFTRFPVTKIMLIAKPSRLQKVREVVWQKMNSQIMMHISDHHIVQIVHPKVNKAVSLNQIAKDYGVPPEQCIAIGDAPNDAEMMEWAGLGVAVSNAWPRCKQAADVIVPSNDEDGVAAAIEKFILAPRIVGV